MLNDIFTAGLTTMGLPFLQSYQNGVSQFCNFVGKKISVYRDLKMGRFAVIKLLQLPKMSKMGSIICHRIDYSGMGVPRGQQHMPSGLSGLSSLYITSRHLHLNFSLRYQFMIHEVMKPEKLKSLWLLIRCHTIFSN